MIRVEEVLDWVSAHAPFRYAASWDHCGLQVGDPGAMLNRILVALDSSSRTIREAQEIGCQCLVTHHPLIFRPMKAVRADEFPGNLVLRAVRFGIHIIAAHTNLDAAREGTNDHFARSLSLSSVEPLEVDPAWLGEGLYVGMGRVGSLPNPVSLGELAQRTGVAMGHVDVRVVGDPGRQIRRVALCTGSGASLIDLAIRANCDVYVTGDIKYHDAQRAIEGNLSLIDVGHFASEKLILEPLAGYLRMRALRQEASVEVFVASTEQDPFWVSKGQSSTNH